MIDDVAKAYLHDDLRDARQSLLGKLDGVSEFDVRRPLTRTGTNLLGLVKHLTMTEATYLGAVLGRPLADALPRYDDPGYSNRDSLWVEASQSRSDVLGRYERACAHADATIEALPLGAPGHVPWWPRPDVMLFSVLVHVLTETNRHAGHADILREQLDGAVGADASRTVGADDAGWADHRARIETAARTAADQHPPTRRHP